MGFSDFCFVVVVEAFAFLQIMHRILTFTNIMFVPGITKLPGNLSLPKEEHLKF